MQAEMEAMTRHRLIPVIALDREEDALPLARALEAGGLPCAEVTFRTPAAAGAIRAIANAMPQVALCAGTVLTTDQVDRAVDAGAKMIVAPGFNPRVVEHCLRLGVPVLPGCCTPSDIEAALSFGLDTVKFFPAQAAGGVAMLKALTAPYRMMRFVPTGGINADNVTDYLRLPCVAACGGSWMVKSDWIRAGAFDEITRVTAQAVALVNGLQA